MAALSSSPSGRVGRKYNRLMQVLLGPVSIQSVLCNVRVGSAAQLRQKCSSTESAHKGISKRVHNIWGWPPIRKKCLHFFILGIRRPIFLHLLTGFFIGPRYTWGPIYGSRVSLTDKLSHFCKLCKLCKLYKL